MISGRSDLDSSPSRGLLLATIVFIFLIIVGLIALIYFKPTKPLLPDKYLPPSPTQSLPQPTSPVASPSAATSITPRISTSSAKATPSSPPPSPTPSTLSFISSDYKFSLTYDSSRTVHQTPEGSGARFTFYSPSGNFAVHVGPNWSWEHPNRQFNSSFTISSRPTFIYEIAAQKLVDFEYLGNYYTIQCVHNGSQALIAECDKFINSFQLLP